MAHGKNSKIEAGSLSVEIDDHSEEFKQELSEALLRALEICGIQCQAYAVLLCPVDTGTLRNSISHKVYPSEKAVHIGTASGYGAYVELGTGIYAEKGGTKKPWVYKDAKGKWHWTRGNEANPFLKPALNDHADEYREIIKNALENA